LHVKSHRERKFTISQAQLDNWFQYHSPSSDQLPKYQAIREAGKLLASTIVANAPDSADTTAAVRKVREAVMTANQSIACYDGDLKAASA